MAEIKGRLNMNEKKKVLLVDQIGHKTYEYDYAAAKHYSDKYDVTCYISDNTPRDISIKGFRVEYGFHDVYKGNKIAKGLKYLRSLYKLRKYVKKEKFDIINFQWYEIPIVDKMFVKSLKKLYKPAIKIVMTVHGIIPREDYPKEHDSLQKLYQEADAIFLHSEPGLDYFNKCFNTRCPKYMITSAFRDEADYVPIDKTEARKKLGIPLEKKVILSFGTVREDKSLDVLYKAFPKALEENKDLFLLSAGTLNVKEKDYYKSLADACRATGVAKIDFDYVTKEMEPVYYSAADILALPYSYISQSGVAYCGLLFNLPMIASNIPRLDLMAKDGINAEIFEKGNVNEMAEKIELLATDDERLKKYAMGSKRIREQNFSIKRRVELTEKAYEDLLK